MRSTHSSGNRRLLEIVVAGVLNPKDVRFILSRRRQRTSRDAGAADLKSLTRSLLASRGSESQLAACARTDRSAGSGRGANCQKRLQQCWSWGLGAVRAEYPEGGILPIRRSRHGLAPLQAMHRVATLYRWAMAPVVILRLRRPSKGLENERYCTANPAQ